MNELGVNLLRRGGVPFFQHLIAPSDMKGTVGRATIKTIKDIIILMCTIACN